MNKIRFPQIHPRFICLMRQKFLFISRITEFYQKRKKISWFAFFLLILDARGSISPLHPYFLCCEVFFFSIISNIKSILILILINEAKVVQNQTAGAGFPVTSTDVFYEKHQNYVTHVIGIACYKVERNFSYFLTQILSHLNISVFSRGILLIFLLH